MTRQAVWTPLAEAELDDILYYIAYQDRRPETGERIYYQIRDTVNNHAHQQLPGRVHPNDRSSSGRSALSVPARA